MTGFGALRHHEDNMNDQLIEAFSAIVGQNHTVTGQGELEKHVHENRDLYVGKTSVVLKPGSTEEVSRIMTLANETRTGVVPQGGNTGHAAGAIPDESGKQIVVSMERMNAIREIDLDGNVMIAEAGCILETLQTTADEHDRLFPLALGSQGSCQIGGNISSNAGGTGALAYGTTRDLVMGLEVVLPSGEIWNGLRRMKKDNTGYDLKNLFVGAEGTLGIVTAAVLKLFPKPRGKAVAFCGLASVNDCVALLNHARSAAGTGLTGFEFMARTPVALTVQHMQGAKNPLQAQHEWHVLVEISSSRSQDDADEVMMSLLETAFDQQLIEDGTIAQSVEQQKEIWRLRELMPPAQKQVGGSMKHDISVPIHRIPDFLEEAGKIVDDAIDGARVYAFGHLGDCNIHYNISQPEGADKTAFMARQPEINALVNRLVIDYGGSISAEHGIGQMKRELLAQTKSPTELAMMRSIKQTFDPNGIMNPGKVL